MGHCHGKERSQKIERTTRVLSLNELGLLVQAVLQSSWNTPNVLNELPYAVNYALVIRHDHFGNELRDESSKTYVRTEWRDSEYSLLEHYQRNLRRHDFKVALTEAQYAKLLAMAKLEEGPGYVLKFNEDV